MSLSVPRRAGRYAAAIVTVAASMIAAAPTANATPVTVTRRGTLVAALRSDQAKLTQAAQLLRALDGSGVPAGPLRAEVRADRGSVMTLRAAVRGAAADCRCSAAWAAEDRLAARVTLVRAQARLAEVAAADGVFAGHVPGPADASDALLNMSPTRATHARAALRDLDTAGSDLQRAGRTVRRLLHVAARSATVHALRARTRLVNRERRALRRPAATARAAMTRLGRQLELAGYGTAPRPGQRYAASTRAAAAADATHLAAVLTRVLNSPAQVPTPYWAPLRGRLGQWRTELDNYRNVLRAGRDQHLVGLTIQLVAARRHDVAALTRTISLVGRAGRLAMVTGGHGDSPQLRTLLLQRLMTGAISQDVYDAALMALADGTPTLAVLEWPGGEIHALLDPADPHRFTRDAALAVYAAAVERAGAAKTQLLDGERAVTAALG